MALLLRATCGLASSLSNGHVLIEVIFAPPSDVLFVHQGNCADALLSWSSTGIVVCGIRDISHNARRQALLSSGPFQASLVRGRRGW